MKENLRSENEEYKIMRLSSIKSKIKKKKSEILLNILYVIKKNLFFFFCMYKIIKHTLCN